MKKEREGTSNDKVFFFQELSSLNLVFSVSFLVLEYQNLIFLCVHENINLFAQTVKKTKRKKIAFVKN